MTSPAWTGADAHALRLRIGFSIEEFAAALEIAPRTVAYWSSRPETEPRPAIQRLLGSLRDAHQQGSRGSVATGTAGIDPVIDETDWFFAQAAQITPGIGTEGIEVLACGVQGLARTYNTRPLLNEFQAAAGLQRQSAELLAQTSRPGEIADLYMTIAQLGALMASCAFDLGRSSEANRLTTAALVYADRAGDPSLSAWILGLRASLELWASQPVKALKSIDRGLAIAPTGQPRFRLHHIGARAAAAAGDPTRAVDSLRLADVELDGGGEDRLSSEVGGEFYFDPGRAAACASATWLRLQAWDKVNDATEQAIGHYRGSDGASTVPMLGARLDVASACVQSGDLDAAKEHLTLAFAEAAEHRYSLVARVRQLAKQLEKRPNEHRAIALHETASEWLAASDPSS